MMKSLSSSSSFFLITLLLIVAQTIVGVVKAEKDTSYYPNGITDPNVKTKMYWADAHNVLQDLSQFDSLYIRYHGCVWATYGDGSDDDVEDAGCGVDGGENYWYMGHSPCYRAQASFSLYGVLKSDRGIFKSSRKKCAERTYINSFFTKYGVYTLANQFGIDTTYVTSQCTTSQIGNNNNYNNGDDDNGDGDGDDGYLYFDSSSYQSEVTGCSRRRKFVSDLYQGAFCKKRNYYETTDYLRSFNSALEDINCEQIYNAADYDDDYVEEADDDDDAAAQEVDDDNGQQQAQEQQQAEGDDEDEKEEEQQNEQQQAEEDGKDEDEKEEEQQNEQQQAEEDKEGDNDKEGEEGDRDGDKDDNNNRRTTSKRQNNNNNNNKMKKRKLGDNDGGDSIAENLLAYSTVCSVSEYPNGDCPDPFGKKHLWTSKLDARIQSGNSFMTSTPHGKLYNNFFVRDWKYNLCRFFIIFGSIMISFGLLLCVLDGPGQSRRLGRSSDKSHRSSKSSRRNRSRSRSRSQSRKQRSSSRHDDYFYDEDDTSSKRSWFKN